MNKNNFNPFNPNSVVVPNLFAGRSKTVLDISNKLSQLKHNMPASFFIHGERGIGKTALSKTIKYISSLKDSDLYNLNLLTSYYSVETGQDLGSVLQASINNLTERMDSGLLADIGSRLGSLFKNGKFSIGAFGASLGVDMTKSEIENDITIKDQTVSILSNILQSIRNGDTNDGILIIIDEVHNLANLPSAASIFRNISTTLDVDGNGQVAFLLIGYDEDLEKFFSEDQSARRMFDIHRLDVMPDKDAIDVLIKGFDAGGYKWDDAVLIRNIKAAGGYPHSIQVLGHNLIECDTDSFIDSNDWNEAIFRSSKELETKEFSKMYAFGRPPTEKDKILIYMAQNDKPLTKIEIREKNTSKNAYKEIASLKRIGAIKENEDKTIILHSQLFRTAILLDYFIRQRQKQADINKLGAKA